MQKDITNELLSSKDAEIYLKCSRQYLYLKRKDGTLKYVRAGKKILLLKSSIDKFLGLDEKEVPNEQ